MDRKSRKQSGKIHLRVAKTKLGALQNTRWSKNTVVVLKEHVGPNFQKFCMFCYRSVNK